MNLPRFFVLLLGSAILSLSNAQQVSESEDSVLQLQTNAIVVPEDLRSFFSTAPMKTPYTAFLFLRIVYNSDGSNFNDRDTSKMVYALSPLSRVYLLKEGLAHIPDGNTEVAEMLYKAKRER